METTQEAGSETVINLKKNYSLLQVKDYLLMQEVAEKCDIQTDSIVYFYEQDCSECVKQGYVLTELKRRYPWLRIYSFDRNLDFSLIVTFEGLYDLGDTYPVLIIGEDTYAGFQDIEDVEAYIPELQKRKELETIKKATLAVIEDNDAFDTEVLEISFSEFDNETNSVVYTYISDTDEVIEIVLEKNDGDEWEIINRGIKQ